MANNKQTINIDKFLLSINNMIESKYILIDRRISDVLLAIADTHEVYNLIAECMINFDFKQEWKRATATNIMKLPANDAKRISFIFCFLNNLDDKNLDATAVLEKYFSYDRLVSPYEQFCKNIVAEFGRLVVKKLQIEVENETLYQNLDIGHEEKEDEFSVLVKLLDDFCSYLVSQKKVKHSFMQKNDLVAIVSTFKEVVLSKHVEYFYSYQVAINSAIEKSKNLKLKFADANKVIEEIIRGSM